MIFVYYLAAFYLFAKNYSKAKLVFIRISQSS